MAEAPLVVKHSLNKTRDPTQTKASYHQINTHCGNEVPRSDPAVSAYSTGPLLLLVVVSTQLTSQITTTGRETKQKKNIAAILRHTQGWAHQPTHMNIA